MVQLDHSILQAVLKPARYTGGEWNAVRKDWDTVQCKFALALPDVYEVGMSNLGLAILYEILNRRADIAAERVYAPWVDMEEQMREKGLPLFSLESRRPIATFDFFGFSLQYEMIYSNVLNMLDLAGIPLYAKERGDDMPFVIGGGPCVYNVEPIADFFDFFVIGEGEEVVLEIADAFIAWDAAGRMGGRAGFLTRLLAVDGIYVPAFYEPVYDAAGNFRALRPLHPDARPVIYKRVVRDMNAVVTAEHPIVPYMDIVHNRIMMELFRGCSRGCRFSCYPCAVTYLGGRIFRPRPMDKVIEDLASIDNNRLFIVDNSLAQNKQWEMDLFREMIPFKKKWISHTIEDDPKVLDLAAQAGAWYVYQAVYDTSNYIRERVKRYHDHGIGVEGTILLGLDNQSEDDIKRLIDFLLEIDLDLAEFTVMTPFPHTKGYDDYLRQGRIFDFDWDHYNAGQVVFHPKQMSAERLQELYEYAWDTFYHDESQEQKMFRLFTQVVMREMEDGTFRPRNRALANKSFGRDVVRNIKAS